MLRILLTVILPVALPVLFYLGYVKLVRRTGTADSQELAGPLEKGVWVWLIVAGAGLAMVSLVTWDLLTGVPPGTKLQAPRLEDGRVVPSQVVDEPQ